MNKRPIVIDCDPGVDDALAIVLANACPELEVKAINPVAGNVPYSSTSENTLRLVDYLGMDCRVGKGADRPLLLERFTAGKVHGLDGLGGYVLPKGSKDFDEKNAWDVLYEEAVKAKGELELIILGPCTNVAIALKAYPELENLIKSVTLMAGTRGKGNTNLFAEFNVRVDPHATQIVLDSKIKEKYMCGLDGNLTVALTREEGDEIFGVESRITEFTDYIAKFIDHRNKSMWNLTVNNINDLCAMACMIDPSIAEYSDVNCHIECFNMESIGQTVISEEGEKNLHYLIKADKERYMDMLKEMMRYYK
ncbi:MAG: nucleoside hydrolase [Erysipelotrichaceae bacterium]|nr:nucleoside hydrolase [Erysipelotrichaceae bacterium]